MTSNELSARELRFETSLEIKTQRINDYLQGRLVLGIWQALCRVLHEFHTLDIKTFARIFTWLDN